MNLVAIVLLLLLASSITNAAIVFKETKSSKDDPSVCDVITSQEGKFTYKGGSQASACCTIGGMNDFGPMTTAFTLKSTKSAAREALCCLTPGSQCAGKIRCCNNENCPPNDSQSARVCTETQPPKTTSVSMELERDECSDKSKRFHIKITVKEKGQTFIGDGCCDTNKIHMINYTDHCCSVSNAPFLDTPTKSQVRLTPPCCRPFRRAAGQSVNPSSQKSNGPNYSGKPVQNDIDNIVRFCWDPDSGAYNVTKNLSRRIKDNERMLPGVKDGKLERCSNSTKFLMTAYCCNSLVDRFKDVESKKKACCVSNTFCSEGYPCCSGVCGQDGCRKK